MNNPERANIRVRVGETRQLFNSMDPSPFVERDLDPDCEEFIVSWAREFKPDRPLRIVIHFDREPLADDLGEQVREAVRRHFNHEAEMQGLRLRRLLREGRGSLVIGLLVLAACTSAATFTPTASLGAFGALIVESLVVAGWVAMWHPLEVLLYGLWPVRREQRLLRRLAEAEIVLTSAVPGEPKVQAMA